MAIDFETASTRATPCSVGLVEVESGQVVDRHTWLIRPPIFEFSPLNIALHGITPELCADAPIWQDSLARIVEIANGRPLVAHNAAFDIGVIRDACDATNLPWPKLTYACTLVIGRRAWPGLTTYSLPFLAAHLNLPSSNHHDAAADAAMCAGVACAALKATDCSTLEELADNVRAVIGFVEDSHWIGCHSLTGSQAVPTEPSKGAMIRPEHPLFKKTVAFTGALAVPRREAQQAVVNCGAVAGKGVTRHTDYLVAGYQDLKKLAQGASKSAKLHKAEALKASGQGIEIIGETDFGRLLIDTGSGEISGNRRSSAL